MMLPLKGQECSIHLCIDCAILLVVTRAVFQLHFLGANYNIILTIIFYLAIPEDAISDSDMHEDTPDERITRKSSVYYFLVYKCLYCYNSFIFFFT